jgi:hypothetical protein
MDKFIIEFATELRGIGIGCEDISPKLSKSIQNAAAQLRHEFEERDAVLRDPVELADEDFRSGRQRYWFAVDVRTGTYKKRWDELARQQRVAEKEV